MQIGKAKYSKRNLFHYQFVHLKSRMDGLGKEPGPPRWKAGDWPLEPFHGLQNIKSVDTFIIYYK